MLKKNENCFFFHFNYLKDGFDTISFQDEIFDAIFHRITMEMKQYTDPHHFRVSNTPFYSAVPMDVEFRCQTVIGSLMTNCFNCRTQLKVQNKNHTTFSRTNKTMDDVNKTSANDFKDFFMFWT